jgi:hypothetical protein
MKISPMPDTSNQPTWEKELGELIRDVTKAGFMSKSECRDRFEQIIRKVEDKAREEAYEEGWNSGSLHCQG